jgi:hypothetical protein
VEQGLFSLYGPLKDQQPSHSSVGFQFYKTEISIKLVYIYLYKTSMRFSCGTRGFREDLVWGFCLESNMTFLRYGIGVARNVTYDSMA